MGWIVAVWGLLVAAGALTPSRAQTLARAGQWDQLLVEASSLSASATGPAAKTLGKILEKGCNARRKSNPNVAFGLGLKAVALHETPEASKCLAEASIATDQWGYAEEVLRASLKRHPHDASLQAA